TAVRRAGCDCGAHSIRDHGGRRPWPRARAPAGGGGAAAAGVPQTNSSKPVALPPPRLTYPVDSTERGVECGRGMAVRSMPPTRHHLARPLMGLALGVVLIAA